MQYFDMEHARRAHHFIIDVSGGHHGERDISLLASVLDHIKNDEYYPDIESKISHLVFSVNKSHVFIDGNKRTSIALGAYFLEINGLDFLVSRFIIEMENIAVDVADNRIDKDLFKEIVISIVNEPEFCEALKIKILDALAGSIDTTGTGDDPY